MERMETRQRRDNSREIIVNSGNAESLSSSPPSSVRTRVSPSNVVSKKIGKKKNLQLPLAYTTIISIFVIFLWLNIFYYSFSNSKETQKQEDIAASLSSSLLLPSSSCNAIPTTTTGRNDTSTSSLYKIFYPKRFLEQPNNNKFLKQYKKNLEYIDAEIVVNGGILNTRFLVFNKSKSCQLLYLHIHKNGGTTLERHVSLPTDNYYSKTERFMGRVNFESACRSIMANAYQNQIQEQQQQSSNNEVHVFTFLRDPVSRFLSSLGQVLKLKSWVERLAPCHSTNNTTTDLIDCVLTKIETRGIFLEQHMAPQSFELYKFVMGYDIGVTVMNMSEIDSVLVEKLGAAKDYTRSNKERSTTGSYIRRFPQYRLTHEILTPNMVRRICQIYEMDVLMLKEIGDTFIKTICLQ